MFCPLTNKLLINPVVASNGVTYDEDALKRLVDKESGHILLPNGEKLENSFLKDKVTAKKVRKFLEENPGFIMPISEESKEKFILAVSSNHLKEMELSVNKEPLLLSEKLFGEKTVFQYLAQEGGSLNMDNLCFLLKIAKTKWSASEWYDFFESYIAGNGKASVIVKVIQRHVLNINDNGFSGQNTLLHLAAKHAHRKLVKQLIIKCEADAYLKNEGDSKAKDMAPSRSGIQQLIKESIQKKVFRRLFEPREKELNNKIKSIGDQNAVFRKDLDQAEKSMGNLRNALNNMQEYAENLEDKLEAAKKKIAALRLKMFSRIQQIQGAHNHLVQSAHEKAFFKLTALQSPIHVIEKIEQCSYDLNDFGQKDSYVTLLRDGRYRMACCKFYETVFTPDLAREKAEEDYNKCLLL